MEASCFLKYMMSQGFAVAVAGYLLVRLEGRLEALTISIDFLCERTGLAGTQRDEAPR